MQLSVPPATPPGSYSFRLDAVAEADPDEDFTEGPSVAFDVAAPPAPKRRKFPWWILAIVGAVVLLIVIGVVIWLVTKGDGGGAKTPVPPVTGLSQAEAERTLAAAGFRSKVVRVRVGFPAQVGTVRSQDPTARTQKAAGTLVTIRIGALATRLPVGPPPTRTLPSK